MEKLRAHATSFGNVNHYQLQLLRCALLGGGQGPPPRFYHVHDEVTRFGGTAKRNAQLPGIFIQQSARNIFRLTAQVVIVRLHLTARASSPRELAQVHCGFTIHAPALDVAGGDGLGVFF